MAVRGHEASRDSRWVYDAGSAKQLFVDAGLIERMEGLKVVVNRPTLTGEKCVVADRPWEHGLGGYFTVLQDDDMIRMYYETPNAATWEKSTQRLLCYACSKDGVHWEKPELDIVLFEGKKTNILMPTADRLPSSFYGMFKGDCVFRDTNPECDPAERYKLIGGDQKTWVFASPDGLDFAPMFEHSSFRSADTQQVAFFDARIGRYVLYGRAQGPKLPHSQWMRLVIRTESEDLSAFEHVTERFHTDEEMEAGKRKNVIVLWYDDEDQERLDGSRFVAMDVYNSAAVKYPYAANATFMFPSAFYHYRDQPTGTIVTDKATGEEFVAAGGMGLLDIQFAASGAGVRWNRFNRETYIALDEQKGETSLYMGPGIVRRGDTLYQYYWVGHELHGNGKIDFASYITRAEQRLDGFVSVDASRAGGTLTTAAVTFSGERLELNVKAEAAEVGLLDEQGRPIPGYGLADCDTISGDHVAAKVSWRGQSDVSKLAGRTVKLTFSLTSGKLFALQFVAT